MLRLKYLEKNEFDKFVIKQDMSHYMQSQAWGDFSKATYNLTPYYLGLVNEKNEIIGATLLLEKTREYDYNTYYIPYGYIIDFNKKELVKEMTKKIKELLKNKKLLSIKMNPNIYKYKTNYLGEKELNTDYNNILNTLKYCGFKHIDNDKTNTYIIDLEQTEDKIREHFSNEIKEEIKNIKNVVIDTTKASKKEIELLKDNKYNKDYYETIYDTFNGNSTKSAPVIIGKIKTINEFEKELKSINNQISIIPIDHLTKSSKDKLELLTKKKKEINNSIEKYKENRKQFGNEVIINIYFLIRNGDKAYILNTTNVNNIENNIEKIVYYDFIKYCKKAVKK